MEKYVDSKEIIRQFFKSYRKITSDRFVIFDILTITFMCIVVFDTACEKAADYNNCAIYIGE